MPRVTVRHQPSETGLARVCQSPRGYDVRVDKRDVGSVRPLTERGVPFSRRYVGWYWCARFGDALRNTCDETPHGTKELARDACIAWVKEQIAAAKAGEKVKGA